MRAALGVVWGRRVVPSVSLWGRAAAETSPLAHWIGPESGGILDQKNSPKNQKSEFQKLVVYGQFSCVMETSSPVWTQSLNSRTNTHRPEAQPSTHDKTAGRSVVQTGSAAPYCSSARTRCHLRRQGSPGMLIIYRKRNRSITPIRTTTPNFTSC